MQGIHWAMGGFGYFPTYLLGTLYASQLFEAFAKDYPDWEKRVKKGELVFIKKWLGDQCIVTADAILPFELIERVTGTPFTPKPFLDYLTHKVKGLKG